MPNPAMPGSGAGMAPPYRESTNQPIAGPETTNGMPPSKSTEDTEIPALPPTEKPENHKFQPTKSETEAKTTTAPHHAAAQENTQANTGHDAAHPVSYESRIMGYPAWLVISLGVLLVLVLLMSVLLCAVCVRRRRRQKTVDINKEIDKIPEPLDSGKLATIGIPPPLYTTTPVHQTDELSLPPLDIDEDTVTDEKPPLDEDADDESDDKSGDEQNDKKEKKEKK